MKPMRCLAAVLLLSACAAAADVSGMWMVTVLLDSGERATPTFELKQAGNKVTGVYRIPTGEEKITGTVAGSQITLEFETVRGSQTVRSVYTGSIEAPGRMSGTMRVEADRSVAGKWRAAKP